jgi:hypothetical protein
MPVTLRRIRRKSCPRLRVPARLAVEALEDRSLPSVTSWPGLTNPVLSVEPNDTLDVAQGLGALSGNVQVGAVGTIGDGSAGAADVDWYSFSLAGTANVSLKTLARLGGSSLNSVLTLYTSDGFNFNELAQDDGGTHGGDSEIDRLLGPGTYYLAVSGSGNSYFNPFLANSGNFGSTGDYGLSVTSVDAGLGAFGPVVLATNPGANSALSSSPMTIRIDLSGALDTSLFTYDPTQPDQTIQLIDTSTNQPVALGSVNFDYSANELQLTPAGPLAPGSYQVILAGDSSAHLSVLRDLSGNPLGADSPVSPGQDFTFGFQVTGTEGGTGADDTAVTAHFLGDVTGKGVLQVTGAIGDDPAYNPANADPNLANPASDVDLYHFQITGAGKFAFGAEVFAARFGSLFADPALTLFDSNLNVIAVNDNTQNNAQATNGTVPLFNEPVIFSGLTAGDYYLGVSSAGNVSNLSQGILPGTNGVYTPAQSHSGSGGFSTFPYVLNLEVQPASTLPQVASVSIQAGAVLSGPPGQLVVRFTQPVNLAELSFQAFQQTSTGVLAAVYVEGAAANPHPELPDANAYVPRLVSYDAATNTATFIFLDPLPPGLNVLHLSGGSGLTDLAGQPLVGNDPSGDYVVPFTVGEPPLRNPSGNPLPRQDQEPNNDAQHPQDLGILFPRDLQTGVNVIRDFTGNPAGAPSDTADYYRFQILQGGQYFFGLPSSANLPPGTQPTITDASGNVVATNQIGGGSLWLAALNTPGTYSVSLSGWSAKAAPNVTYTLRITSGVSLENPTPLTSGPAPALRLRLVTDMPTVPVAPPTVTLPVAGSNTGVVPVTTTPILTSIEALLGLPPSALIELSTLPGGGLRALGQGESATIPRLVLQDSVPLPGRDGLRPAIFAGPGGDDGGTGDQGGSEGPDFVLRQFITALKSLWREALVKLLTGVEWSGEPPPNSSSRVPSTEPPNAPADSTPPREERQVPATGAVQGELSDAPGNGDAWVLCMAFLGVIPPPEARRRRERGAAVWVSDSARDVNV